MTGTSLASVRAFSALWGTAEVAIIGLFAGRAISPQAGLFSAAALSFHPFHLAYSQEARPYAMVFALATVTIWMASGWPGKSASGSSFSPRVLCCGHTPGESSSGWCQLD
ncbi:MAG: hypothetical protein EXQ58_05095 [Acidobacteria bacterium]|nr:hypothetical protein [Acidobacteriota bacterium]